MSDCLDSLRETLSSLDDKEIIQALRDIEALSRRTHAVMPDLVADIDSRGIAGRAGLGTTQRLVAGMLHLSAEETRARWPATADAPSPAVIDHPGFVKPTTRGTGSTAARPRCRTAACYAHPITIKSTNRGGISPSAADVSSSDHPTIVEPNRHPLTNPLRR
jgi:hypothetical protein